MRELGPEETLLKGSWVSKNGRTVEDDVSERIRWLVRSALRRRASDPSGWDTLYEDPRDGRLWELLYPHSEMHGGGPPSLQVVTREAARSKYKFP